MGEVGIPRREFLFDLRRWEIDAIIRGYRKRARTSWDTARWQTFLILTGMGAKISNEKELRVFPWDHDEDIPITEDEAEDMMELMDSINKKREENDESEEGRQGAGSQAAAEPS